MTMRLIRLGAFALLGAVLSGQAFGESASVGGLSCVNASGSSVGGAPSCGAPVNGRVDIGSCSCAAGYVLVKRSSPSTIGVPNSTLTVNSPG